MEGGGGDYTGTSAGSDSQVTVARQAEHQSGEKRWVCLIAGNIRPMGKISWITSGGQL